jgi:spermidine synthase
MKPSVAPLPSSSAKQWLILLVALAAGFCTMAYEVVWFRVLKYFVDNSIHSFAIMLTTFLFGIMAGGFLVSRFTDKRKDAFLFLGCLETCIGFLCILSIPLISGLNGLIIDLNKVFGTGWSGEIAIRFMVFSLALFLPTALMGGAFPLFTRMYSEKSGAFGKSFGEVYGLNTVGGVLGSIAGGFVLIPLRGVQNSIIVLSIVNVLTGLACIILGSTLGKRSKAVLSACLSLCVLVAIVAVPRNAFLSVYTAKYPPPANRLLYCKENVNGTTAVFQDIQKTGQKFFLIDGTGEVSTDYFSMRAFRFLSTLPALYAPAPKNALIVTFGSGIVAGSIAGLPGLEHVDCVEICKQAFDASRYFSDENHDVIHNPKVNLIVNDGRNYVLTTRKRFDIISADATHPTSSDSWILYTKEFYQLCRDRLADRGIMCQWIPLHGILEKDYKVILATFHAAFPYVAVYYSGGYKTIGHTVLLGSKAPLKVDFKMAKALLGDARLREDLAQVNVFDVYDLFNGFVFDQEAIDEFRGEVPLNTDDKPCIIFSKFKLLDKPFMGLVPLVKYRKNIFPQLYDMDTDSAAAIKATIDSNFEAMGFTLGGQILEFKEYNVRMAQDFNQPRDAVVRNLLESKAIFEQIISNYQTALRLNANDLHTKFLLNRVSSEYSYLNSFLDAANQPR